MIRKKIILLLTAIMSSYAGTSMFGMSTQTRTEYERGSKSIYPWLLPDAPKSLQDYATKEFRRCGVTKPVQVKIFKSEEKLNNLSPGMTSRGIGSEKKYYLKLASYGARELHQHLVMHQPFPQHILADDDVTDQDQLVNKYKNPQERAKQIQRIMGYHASLRHEAGHVHYNDQRRSVLSQFLLSIAVGAAALIATPKTLSIINTKIPLTKTTAYIAAFALPAIGTALGLLVHTMIHPLQIKHQEKRADDFSITHTHNPQELLAMANYFKKAHEGDMQYELPAIQKNHPWLSYLFRKRPQVLFNLFTYRNHIPPGPRYFKFKAASERLQAKQGQEAQSATP